jgi:D-alanyl-D-alanine carboxypeptidase
MRTILALWLVVCGGILNAQPLNKPKLDSLFDLLAAKDKAMGSLVLSRDGSVIYSRAIGWIAKDKMTAVAANPESKYRIGSITKMFTSTMMFQLIEDKKVSMTTPLSMYYPQLPNSDKITIGHMLNHRSGLFNFTNDPSFPNWMSQPRTEKEMIAMMSTYPVDFQPDEKFAYSNTNYLLLGYIIEKVTKKTYPENLRGRITSKLGLKDTYYGGKIDAGKNEAASYHFNGGWEQMPETDMSIPGGAGAIVSTPTDLAKFIEALFAGKFVSASSLEQMKTLRDGMGMGLFSVPFGSRRAFGHNGQIDGSSSNLYYFIDEKLTIANCSNGVVLPVNDIMIAVLSIYFNLPYKLPDFDSAPAVILAETDLEKLVGTYVSTQLPLKIMITRDKTSLYAQATGQSMFPLTATAEDKFKFEPAGVVMEFDAAKRELTLKQGGGTFLFARE